ncbi:MAG: HlyD family efflux transporter periplasmic adaptor subunit, partial [Gemmatimonadaceae bacterium]|nr:HlyD family efflux transporter periplasmic adaptor subunit [Gemmatimonadaceae bacterium]
AEGAVAALTATASDLVLIAPIDGQVISRAAEVGEVVAPGQAVFTLADPSRPSVRVFVSQDHLPFINPGDSVEARLDALPDAPFRGRVAAISPRAEFTPRVALTEKERADLLFAVKIVFTDSTHRLKAGLPVTVRFRRAATP